jgi:hypothetical protein
MARAIGVKHAKPCFLGVLLVLSGPPKKLENQNLTLKGKTMSVIVKCGLYTEKGYVIEQRNGALLVQIGRSCVWFTQQGRKKTYKELYGTRQLGL